jgi:hypothetical protein
MVITTVYLFLKTINDYLHNLMAIKIKTDCLSFSILHQSRFANPWRWILPNEQLIDSRTKYRHQNLGCYD